jgi:uncharacterized membrane protein YphA (DoxX/SURF4 family)
METKTKKSDAQVQRDVPATLVERLGEAPTEAPTFGGYLIALRVALGAFFVLAGASKLLAPETTLRIIAQEGLPWPLTIAVSAAAVEIAGGALLAAGFHVGASSAVLATFVVLAATTFHDPIGLSPGEAHAALVRLAMDGIILGALVYLHRRTPAGAEALS